MAKRSIAWLATPKFCRGAANGPVSSVDDKEQQFGLPAGLFRNEIGEHRRESLQVSQIFTDLDYHVQHIACRFVHIFDKGGGDRFALKVEVRDRMATRESVHEPLVESVA